MKNFQEEFMTKKETGRSLSFVMNIWMGIAFVAALAICSVIQYMLKPEMSLTQHMTHHVVDFLLVGLVMCAISWIIIRVVLVRPVTTIFNHLYTIGGGGYSQLQVKTKVREIQSIVDGINVMFWRMRQRTDHQAVQNAQQKVKKLKDQIGCLHESGIEVVPDILNQLHDLEDKLCDILLLDEKIEKVVEDSNLS